MSPSHNRSNNKDVMKSMRERDKAIISITNNIKKKYLALKLGRDRDDKLIAKLHQPLLEPLKDITNKLNDGNKATHFHHHYPPPPPIGLKPDDEGIEEFKTPTLSGVSVKKRKLLLTPESKVKSDETSIENLPLQIQQYYLKRGIIDDRMGIRRSSGDNGWKIGSKAVQFKPSHIIIGGEKQFQATPGLYELIQLKEPKHYTDDDLKQYKAILQYTSAHRHNYEYDGYITGNRSSKYVKIIKPLFNVGDGEGRGISDKFLEVNSKSIQYKYWDDVNELVDRLRLLHASQVAGNNSHINEITSIIEELKESNIIS